MVGQSSGTLPTRVQILVLAPFPGFSRIYWRYALSGKRRSRRRRGAIGDFGNLQICRWISSSARSCGPPPRRPIRPDAGVIFGGALPFHHHHHPVIGRLGTGARLPPPSSPPPTTHIAYTCLPRCRSIPPSQPLRQTGKALR
jgi:hypothetical protein